MPSCNSSDLDSFNPRSPPKRGATRSKENHRDLRKVSIHAPLRREERHDRRKITVTFGKFQSTLPSEERIDQPS